MWFNSTPDAFVAVVLLSFLFLLWRRCPAPFLGGFLLSVFLLFFPFKVLSPLQPAQHMTESADKPKTTEADFLNKIRDKRSRLANERALLERQEQDIKERLISVRAEINGIEYALDLAEKTMLALA